MQRSSSTPARKGQVPPTRLPFRRAVVTQPRFTLRQLQQASNWLISRLQQQGIDINRQATPCTVNTIIAEVMWDLRRELATLAGPEVRQ